MPKPKLKKSKLEKLKLNKIEVLSLAKIYALIMAVVGLIIGIIYASRGVFTGIVSGSAGLGVMLSILGIIFMPIIYGILGFIVGAFGAWLYNLIAKKIGGIELEFGK